MENDNRNTRIKEMTDAINKMYQEGTSTQYDHDDGPLSSLDINPSLNRPRSERVATGMRSASASSRRVTSVNEADINVPTRTRSAESPVRTRTSASGSSASRTRTGAGAGTSSQTDSPVRRSSQGTARSSSQTRPSSRTSSARTSATRAAGTRTTATSRTSSAASDSSQGSSEAAVSSTRRYSDVLEANQRRKNTASGAKKSSAPAKSKKSSDSKKKGISGFGKFLIIYSALLLIAIIVTTLILNSFLKTYEKNQPANVAAEVVKQFDSSDKLRSFLDSNADIVNQSTAILNYQDAFISAVEGKKIAYIEDPSRSTSEITCYRLTADSMPIASITLTKGEKGSFGLSSWVLSSIDTSNAFTDVKTYSILVPEGSSVIVNGTELGASMISGTGVPEVLQTSSRFISDPPTYSTYNVKVVGDVIDVSGTDPSGANLVFSRTENSFVAGGQASEEFIESVRDRVESGLREYALWFIYNAFNLDEYIVDGCELSAYLFGGEFDGESYDPINPWLYNFEEIEDFEFSTKEAKNYTKYSDDCFTVDISYKLDITFTDPSYSDNNQKLDATWVWVKQGDEWYLSASKAW